MSAPRSTSASDVVLRDVIEADLPVFLEHQRDPEATRMAAFTSRDECAFVAHWSGILADPGVVTRTVLLDGQAVGHVVSFARAGVREVGYMIGREHWGRGVATRALAAFLVECPTRPLYAVVAARNGASIRVLEKCGFTAAPTARELVQLPDDDLGWVVPELT